MCGCTASLGEGEDNGDQGRRWLGRQCGEELGFEASDSFGLRAGELITRIQASESGGVGPIVDLKAHFHGLAPPTLEAYRGHVTASPSRDYASHERSIAPTAWSGAVRAPAERFAQS